MRSVPPRGSGWVIARSRNPNKCHSTTEPLTVQRSQYSMSQMMRIDLEPSQRGLLFPNASFWQTDDQVSADYGKRSRD